MEELKLIIASNIIRLRQMAGITQAELGEKLNYSDKTISKWERGESTPDIFVLTRMAEIFGTDVNSLLSGSDPWQDPVKKQKETEEASRPHFSVKVVTMTAIVSIWTMALILYVILWIVMDLHLWLIFVTAVPLSLIALLVFNSVWNKGRHNLIIVMVLTACLIVLIYLYLLPFNPWQLFLILIPAELLIALCFHIRPCRGKQRKIN